MKTRGMSLIEIIVTTAIGAVVFMILGGVFLAEGRFFDIQNAIADTQVHAYRAVDAAGLFTTSAQAVLSSYTINGTTYSSTTTTVVLKLPSITSSGGLIGSTYDYVAIGQSSATSTLFFYDLQPGTGSNRRSGKYTVAQFVDKVIFRYNTVTPSAATSIDLYVRTKSTTRGRTIYTNLGKIFYLGSL